MNPLEWLCLDIETRNGRPEQAEAWARQVWSPNPAWKPQTIGERFREALEKKRERLALLDSSPLIVVSVRTPAFVGCFHCLPLGEPLAIGGALAQGCLDERAMLRSVWDFTASAVAPETRIVGHNILGFDMPRSRVAFVRNGLQVPAWLSDPDQPVFDSLREYGRRWTADAKEMMLSLAEVQQRLGLATHKGLVDGGQVPALYEAGQFEAIVKYAILDVLAEAEVFQVMTGRSRALA